VHDAAWFSPPVVAVLGSPIPRYGFSDAGVLDFFLGVFPPHPTPHPNNLWGGYSHRPFVAAAFLFHKACLFFCETQSPSLVVRRPTFFSLFWVVLMCRINFGWFALCGGGGVGLCFLGLFFFLPFSASLVLISPCFAFAGFLCLRMIVAAWGWGFWWCRFPALFLWCCV